MVDFVTHAAAARAAIRARAAILDVVLASRDLLLVCSFRPKF